LVIVTAGLNSMAVLLGFMAVDADVAVVTAVNFDQFSQVATDGVVSHTTTATVANKNPPVADLLINCRKKSKNNIYLR